MGHLEDMEQIEFLGLEFATWLMVETAQGRGPDNWGECQNATIEIEGIVHLEGPGRGASQVVLRGDSVTESPELRSALAEGKGVRKVKVRVTLGEEDWTGTLDAKTLEWRSVKVTVPTIPDVNEVVFMRIQAFERLTRLLEEWFSAFLRLRMSERKWEGALEKIRAFAGGR